MYIILGHLPVGWQCSSDGMSMTALLLALSFNPLTHRIVRLLFIYLASIFVPFLVPLHNLHIFVWIILRFYNTGMTLRWFTIWLRFLPSSYPSFLYIFKSFHLKYHYNRFRFIQIIIIYSNNKRLFIEWIILFSFRSWSLDNSYEINFKSLK